MTMKERGPRRRWNRHRGRSAIWASYRIYRRRKNAICLVWERAQYKIALPLFCYGCPITHLLHARLGYQNFFPFFCSTHSGSKCGPYRVILDRVRGQYRKKWIGLGCRGLASCMTTVTCREIHHFKLQEGCMNDPKQSTTRTELWWFGIIQSADRTASYFMQSRHGIEEWGQTWY